MIDLRLKWGALPSTDVRGVAPHRGNSLNYPDSAENTASNYPPSHSLWQTLVRQPLSSQRRAHVQLTPINFNEKKPVGLVGPHTTPPGPRWRSSRPSSASIKPRWILVAHERIRKGKIVAVLAPPRLSVYGGRGQRRGLSYKKVRFKRPKVSAVSAVKTIETI